MQILKPQTGYTDRNNPANQFYHEGESQSMQTITIKTEQPREPGTFTKRIGSTTYRVGVHFSQTSRETMGDKILRLIKNEAHGKAAGE